MSVNLPSPIMQKVARFKSLQHKDGKFLIWGNPAFIDPVYIQLYYHKLVESHTGFEHSNRVRYYTAKFQSMIGMKIINERFGYAKTLGDKKKILNFNMGQSEVLGLGKFEVAKQDFNNNVFIIRSKVSPFADEYKRFFGVQKNPVDYWISGCLAGIIESLIKKQVLCLETSCVASGNTFCEFMIKPEDQWDKKSTLFKTHSFLTGKEPSLNDLGAKIPPYIQLR